MTPLSSDIVREETDRSAADLRWQSRIKNLGDERRLFPPDEHLYAWTPCVITRTSLIKAPNLRTLTKSSCYVRHSDNALYYPDVECTRQRKS